MIQRLLLSLFLVALSSCMFEEGEISIKKLTGSGAKSSGRSVVTNVAIVSDQLVIDGDNLDGVTNVRITGPSGFDQTFAIESQSGSNLVANGLSNIAFAVGSVFDLILTDAQGAATHQVTFTLQDGAVTASKLDDMGAGVGQVLRYNGTTWVASDLNSLTYAGNWNASTNSPDLTGGGSLGEYYIVSNAGSTDLSGGTGTNSWAVGDWAVWNNVASQWEKVANGSSVTSFNGRSGPVTPATNDYTWAQIDKTTSPIGDLSNVNTTGAGVGSVLKFDGTNWVVGTDDTAGGAGSVDSSTISDGSIVDADVNASAAIAQSKIANLTTDLAAKVPLAGGTMTGDLTVPNLITSGNVDGVDVSALNTTVGNNTTAIAGKQNTITTGTTAQYLRGDLSLSTFATDARSAAVLNSTAGTETDQAASVAAMKAYVAANGGTGDLLDGGNTTGATIVVGTNDAQSLQLETNNAPALTILNGGNVGVGTTNPATKLDVEGKITVGPIDATAGNTGAIALEELAANGTDSVSLRAPDALAANYVLTLPADDGTPGQVLSTDGSGVLSWSTAGAGGVTSVTATAPLASSGGTTPNLTITQANGSTNGYLSSADWTTFNNKQAAITTGATTQYLRGDLSLATLQDDVRATLLTGFSSGAGTVAATDTMLQAINKLDGNIAAKENAITAAAATTYFRGDKTFVTLDTAVVPENTNLYHTTARARTAAVVNSTAGTETDQAASVAAMKTYVAANSGTGDITDGGNTSGATVIVGTNDAQSLQLETNNAVAMTILSGGNVGVGTDTPARLLHVAGPMRMTAASLPGSPAIGDIAVDSGDANKLKYYDGSSWLDLTSGGGSTTSTEIMLQDPYDDNAVTTVAHGQGSIPKKVIWFLENKTAEHGYSPGDRVHTLAGQSSTTDGFSIFATSTHVGVTGTASSPNIISRTTQGTARITDANWRLGVMILHSGTGSGAFTDGGSVAHFTGGDVGIGTTTPSTKLDVEGKVTVGPIDATAGNTGAIALEELAANGTNSVTFRSPDALAADYTLTMPADDGTTGQVLTTDGSGVLSWTTASGVTSVTASAPLASSGGATPNLTITQANGSTNGYLSSADWTTFNNKQAAITTGATTQYLRGDLTLATLQDDVRSTLLTGFSSGAGTVAATDTILQAINKLDGNIAANTSSLAGKQNTITTGTTAQYMRGDLSLATFATDARTAAVLNSTAGSQTDQAASVAAMKSYVSANAGDISNGGNTTGATVVVGTNDAQSLQLETNNSPAVTILNGGNVGIGTTTANAKLVVDGAAVNNGATADTDRTINFSTSNLAYTTTTCGSFTLQNMRNGGSYTLAVQGSSTNTCSFTASGFTVHMPTDHGATTASTHTLYTFLVMGTHIYVAWVPGL